MIKLEVFGFGLKKISIFLIAFLLLGFSAQPAFALDQSDEYPSLMWGTTTVIEGSGSQQLTIYSQTEGNVIMRNVAATAANSPGLNFVSATKLFSLGDNPLGGLKLQNSRTEINGAVKATTVVLRQAGVNVFGDSVNADGSYNYWGQHLRQTTDSSGSNAFWQQKLYNWNGGNSAKMDEIIGRLLQNSRELQNKSLSGSFGGVCLLPSDTEASCPEINQYPDGRVWYYGSSFDVSDLNYQKKSTIILGDGNNQSNLTINGSISTSDQSGSIGFIVRKGDLTIDNPSGENHSINASFFVPNGTIKIIGSGNLTLTGSFVAKDFSVPANGSINFVQDTRAESAWPPGFRDLSPFLTANN